MSEKASKRKLTDLQEAFLDHLFSEAEGDIRKAMDLAGYGKGTPQKDVLIPLAEEISQRSIQALSSSSAKAVFSLVSVLNAPHQNGASNRIKAAGAILDRAGIQKKTEDVSIKLPDHGIVILPAKVSATVTVSEEEEEE